MKMLQFFRGIAVLSVGLTAYNLWKASHSSSLSGEVVLITGASRGLGLLLAREFAQEGCQVIICARVQEELDAAQAQLHEWGSNVLALLCDVSEKTQVDAMIETVMASYGRVDILVNNAGTIQVTPIQSASLDDFEQAMDTMFWGGLYTTMALLPHMQQRCSGHIVNITSVGGKVAVPHLLPYVAAKFAMTGFSEGLSAELTGSGIQVTTIIPGLMRTGSYLNAFFKGHQQDEFRWFSVGDNLPFISIDGERAAQAIVQAVRRGETEYILTLPAKGLTRLYGLLPNVAIRIIGAVARFLLPAPTHNPVTERGIEIQQRLGEPFFNWLTGWGRSAAERFNQYSAPAHKAPYHVESSNTESRS
jgi:NAD(P)-dependent dehydrogenase (short-subunit alcohol dehydrogenase family)